MQDGKTAIDAKGRRIGSLGRPYPKDSRNADPKKCPSAKQEEINAQLVILTENLGRVTRSIKRFTIGTANKVKILDS